MLDLLLYARGQLLGGLRLRPSYPPITALYLVSVRQLQLLPHGFLQIPFRDGHLCR